MYLLYDEYKNMGGYLEETTYNDLEYEARAQIDYWTFNRLQSEETQSEAVKRCVYKLVKLIYDIQQAGMIDTQGESSSGVQAGIASQSNDGVSISYNVLSASEVVEQNKLQIASVIRKYLNGAKNSLGRLVLYRGLYPGE